jgi:hypothetical protein
MASKRHGSVSVKRMGGAPDLASRTLVFGPDANADPLICGDSDCEHGKEEDWSPTMKKSQCPVCGNRDGHKLKKKKK